MRSKHKTQTILFVAPPSQVGMPVNKRIAVFIKRFEKDGFAINDFNSMGWLQKIYSILKVDYIFLSMPPFRYWLIVLLFGKKVILDWRDGWSIAMRTGYGGTVQKKRWQALIARGIELISILFAKKIIVCTPGLLDFHTRFLSKEMLQKFILIFNGHDIDFEDDWFEEVNLLNKLELKVACVGKFVEYGVDKAKLAIKTLLERYPKAIIKFDLIGADKKENSVFFQRAAFPNRLEVNFVERMPYCEAIKEIRKKDLTITIIRDSEYDFGTKVFDYIACGKPILDIFPTHSPFREFFSGCFDNDFVPEIALEKAKSFKREKIIQSCCLWKKL